MFGVASLLLAALYLFGQRDIKRMLAYSSVEHMGILAIGVSFGAPIALAGVLLHVLAHAAAKGNAFMGAGVLVHKFGTKRIAAIRGGLDVLPWSGPLFLLAILALGAMPPFGIFRSEFEIVEGGFASASNVTAAILIIGVTVAFLGLAATTTQLLLVPRRTPGGRRAEARAEVRAPALAAAGAGHGGGPEGGVGAGPVTADGASGDPVSRAPRPAPVITRGEPSAWMVVPVAMGAVVLIVLGVHPPAELTGLLARAVHELGERADDHCRGHRSGQRPGPVGRGHRQGGGRQPVRRPVRHRRPGRPAAHRAPGRACRAGDTARAPAARGRPATRR